MTSLVSWIAVDSRAPTSIYLSSDSRISLGATRPWDYGRKLFASRNYPEILGYVGDVLFPSQVLGQIVYLIDSNLLFNAEEIPATKWSKITSVMQTSFEAYPGEIANPFTVIYCSRKYSGMTAIFHMFKVSWTPQSGWNDHHQVELPNRSGIIDVMGSGENVVKRQYAYWSRTDQARTSRSVFSAFCDALISGEDKFSGGAPQLVGIYRQGKAETFGIIYNRRRYLLGLPVNESEKLDAVEWRNSLFERCDWRTMRPLGNAQRHSRPR